MSSQPQSPPPPQWFPEHPHAPRLVEALSHVSLEEQQRIANQCQISCGTHSKSQLMQGISHALRRPSFVAGLVEHLSDDEKRVLDHLFWTPRTFHRQDPLIEELAAHVLPEAEYERISQLLDSLESFGLVLSHFDAKAGEEYFIPSDVASSIEGLVQQREDTDWAPVDENVRPQASLPFLFLENLFDFIAFIHKNPVRLTAEQRLFKRARDQIRESLAHPSGNIFQPEALEELSLPGQWELLLDLSRRLEFLDESGDELAIRESFAQWILSLIHI